MSEKNEWKLVPVVPTDDMEAAAEDDYEQTGATFPRWKSAYAAMLNAAPSAPGDAQDEHATYSMQPTPCSLQPVATAFFTEKGEVAYTGIFDRTLKALESVKTTRMGISAGSIDLYAARASAPAAGDARDAERLRRIAWLIGSIFVHGDFKAETVNERELEKLLRENGTFWDTLAQFDADLAASQQQEG